MGTFAYRRALRILPLAYVVMALTWLAGLPAMTEAPWWHLTFTTNLPGVAMPYGLNHFWTLAIEEQVYAVWPALVLFIQGRRWPAIASGLIAFAAASRVAIWATGAPGEQWPLVHLDAFAAGSLVTWCARFRPDVRLEGWFAAFGFVLIGACWAPSGPYVGTWLETGCVLVTAGLVGWAWHRPASSWLTCSPLVYVGTISYGVYVWHASALNLLYQAVGFDPQPEWLLFLAMVCLAIGVASVSWFVLERPINRLKDRAGRHAEQGQKPAPEITDESAKIATGRPVQADTP